MSSFMPFSFNAVELCVTTINEKPWTRAREVCRAPEYNKKTADIVKTFCSKENYAQKYQTISVTSAGKPVDWPKDSQKYDIYTNEEGMYELSFSSQQPKAKDFRRHCFNVLFPHAQQHLSDKSHAMEIEDLTSRVQALEITNEAHQQTIEDKMQHLHCSMMIYKMVTTKYRPFSMKTGHCKHKGMYIGTSYKNVKTSLPILRQVMFLME